MENLKHARLFTFIGLVFLLTGLVATGLLGHFTLLTAAICVLGIAFGSLMFIPRVTRNISLYLNMSLYSFFFIASLVMFFLVLQRHPANYDATTSRRYSVSESTKSFLKRLSEPIRITAFVRQGERSGASLLLKEYARYSPQVRFTIHDPFREIGESRRFGLDVAPGDLFIEKVTTGTQRPDRVVRLSGLEEEALTNGIVQALRGRDLVLYFLTGHGELSIEKETAAAVLAGRRPTQNNLAWLKEQLGRSHIRALSLPLGQRGRVPSDAAAIICIAPRTDLSAAEKESLRSWLNDGGRAFFCLNPDTPQVGGQAPRTMANIADLAADYGVLLPAEIVVQPLSKSDRFLVPVQFAQHSITRIGGDEPFMFDQARPVMPSKNPPENVTPETILMSPDTSWRLPVEEFAKGMTTGEINLTVQPSELASAPLGVASTMLPSGAPEEKAARLVVIGNATFSSTEIIEQKGWLLFQNTINWLTSAGDQIAIPAKEIENTPITLTDGQKQFLFMLLVIIVPTLLGLAGLGYTISRREVQ
jgi:ABC-2 type transport system permease protein